jgi:hypothetical protein
VFGDSYSKHTTLADYFEQQPFSNRKLDEYPYHLMRTNQSQQLEEFLVHVKTFTSLYTDVNKFEFFKYWNSVATDWRVKSTTQYSGNHMTLHTSQQLFREHK